MALTYAVNHSTLKTNLNIWCPLNEYSAGSGAVSRYDAHSGAVFTDNNTTPSTTGGWNRAANFQRANSESISTTDTATDITSDFSFSVWVKFTTLTTGQLRPFFGKDGSLSTRSFAAWVYNLAGTHQLRMFVNDTSAHTGEELIVTPSTGNFSTGTWYHIVGTWTASTSTAEFFVNGSSVGTATGSYTSILNSATPFYIGRFGEFSGDYTDAAQQDFALWSKILSGDEISDLYNSGDGMTYGVDVDVAGAGSYDNAHSYGTNYTDSHTCTGTNRYLMVGVISDDTNSITGATYNGVSMTVIEEDDGVGTVGIFDNIVVFGLANPATGSNTVSISTSGTGTGAVYVKTMSYVGVDQTTPVPHSSQSNTNGSTLSDSIDTSVSPSTDNCWVAALFVTDGNGTQSAGAGTRRWPTNAPLDNWLTFADNEGVAVTPAGSDTLVVNITGTRDLEQLIFSLSPVQVAAASTFKPKVMFF